MDEKLKEIIVDQLRVSPERLEPGASLESLGADSLDIVELIMEVEGTFDCTISDEEMDLIRTVQDLMDRIP